MNFHRLHNNTSKDVKTLYEELAICCGKCIPREEDSYTIYLPEILPKKTLPNAAALLLRKLLLTITASHPDYKDKVDLKAYGVFAVCVEVLCDPHDGILPRNKPQAESFQKGIKKLKNIGNDANHKLELIPLQDIEPIIDALHRLLGTLGYL